MKYELVISRDCGVTYTNEADADSIDELMQKAKELQLDEKMLRWAVRDKKTKSVHGVCRIHRKICQTLQKANQ